MRNRLDVDWQLSHVSFTERAVFAVTITILFVVGYVLWPFTRGRS